VGRGSRDFLPDPIVIDDIGVLIVAINRISLLLQKDR